MKTEELRIGNLVNTAVGIIRVEEIPLKSNPLYNPNALHPIPLSPEWLERFGFVFGDNHGYYVLLENIEKGDYDYDNVLYVLTEYEDDICKYVHQLQNLYFANTGKELVVAP